MGLGSGWGIRDEVWKRSYEGWSGVGWSGMEWSKDEMTIVDAYEALVRIG